MVSRRISIAGSILYWWGLALLATALVIALTSDHPSRLDQSFLYNALLVLALIPFAIGGTIHFLLDRPRRWKDEVGS